RPITIFVDNDCSLNGISEALATKLNLTIHEDQHNMMTLISVSAKVFSNQDEQWKCLHAFQVFQFCQDRS
ncbi:TPA: hypothetical protein N0F65_000820, partial [Lagenidium giganteum]